MHKYRIVAMFVIMNIKDMVSEFMIYFRTEFHINTSSANYKT
jgi:hypothetical protein